GFALPATRGNIKQMELVKKAVQKVEAKNIEEATRLAASLEGLEIVFTVKTGEEGKLYGSVTNKDIAEKILAEKNIEIDRKKIDLEEHIKELGEYIVELKLYREVKAGLKVRVEPDEESRELIEAHRKKEEGPEAEASGELEKDDMGKGGDTGREEEEAKEDKKEKTKDKPAEKEPTGEPEEKSGIVNKGDTGDD
ncbi:MAG: 50S ribosomal protein L9, partial [Actinobacteria bacterium]|nr:50S ribosomal protein L9 [Actinomycetota bacterium]